MRNLRTGEVSLLLAGLVIGSSNVHADEPDAPIATIEIDGTQDLAPQFQYSPQDIPPGVTPPVVGANTTTQQQYAAHAINCTMAYGAAAKWGWSVYLTNDFAWSQGLTIKTSPTNTPPSGSGWAVTYGYSYHTSGNPFVLGVTTIFMGPNTTTYILVDTLAHEFAHEAGIQNEDQAAAFGAQVANAYKADNGKKCGGL